MASEEELVEGAVTVMMRPVEADMLRIRHEFLSMPTLCLTVPQVKRLLDVGPDRAGELLAALECEGFLIQTHNGAYRRAQPPMA